MREPWSRRHLCTNAKEKPKTDTGQTGEPGTGDTEGGETGQKGEDTRKVIPVWEGEDIVVSQEVRIVGPNGEKVDVMTFRGSLEHDLKDFVDSNADLKKAVEAEDDDTIETILQEQFYHREKMFYSPDKLVASYGVPAPTPAFVYNALGKRPLPSNTKWY